MVNVKEQAKEQMQKAMISLEDKAGQLLLRAVQHPRTWLIILVWTLASGGIGFLLRGGS